MSHWGIVRLAVAGQVFVDNRGQLLHVLERSLWHFLTGQSVVENTAVVVADFATRAQEEYALKDLLHRTVKLLWRILRFTVLVGATPTAKVAHTRLAVQAVTVRALLGIWLHYELAEATSKQFQCRSEWRLVQNLVLFNLKHF